MDADSSSRLAAARLWAAHRYPYLTTAVFAMTVVVVADGTGTIAVDREWRLYVDPSEVARRSPPVLGLLLVHHCGHLVRDHAGRAGDAGVGDGSARRWTAAADAEINDDLVWAGHDLEPGDVTPARLGLPDARLAEEYYAAIGEPPSSAPDHGSGADGVRRDWERPPAGASRVSEREAALIRARVAEDVLAAARAGDVPAGWQRWAAELARSGVDWRRVLAGEIRAGVAATIGLVDYSYRRPSRRASTSPDIVLPALERPVPEVAVVVDTSASMDEAQLGRAVAEVDGVIRRLGVHEASVLSVDAAVHGVARRRRADPLALAGGGGTDMSAGIAAAALLRPRPCLIVVLTDGDTDWPDRAPAGTRVVVGLVTDAIAPPPTPSWARTVVIPVARGGQA